MFPILFVFAHPDGRIAGWQLLGFPSLCRGGLHYPERLAWAHGAAGLQQHDGELVDRYRSLFDAKLSPLIGALAIDTRGADGTQPLFQPDFREWLRRVMRLAVTEGEAEAAGVGDRPGDALPGRAGGLVLTLPNNMIPTVAVTVQRSNADTTPSGQGCSFLVAGDERSRPAALIALPPGYDDGDELAGDFIPFFPSLQGGEGQQPLPPLAIRMPRARPLNEAELLIPVAAPALAVEPTGAIDVIVPTHGRSDGELAEALQSLALQAAVGEIRLIFLGTPTPQTSRLGERLFKSVREAGDIKVAAAMSSAPLIGYLGHGVVLHDRRTLAQLAAMARRPGVASASAVLVSIERRGRGWNVVPVDAGEFAITDGDRGPEIALALWRETLANRRPPGGLWLARRANVEAWVDGATEAGGLHLCTSRITASASASPTGAAALHRHPPPRRSRSSCWSDEAGRSHPFAGL